MRKKRNIILYVGSILPSAVKSIREYEKKTGEKFRIATIRHSKKKLPLATRKKLKEWGVIDIKCDLHNPYKITKALRPYEEELIAITTRGEEDVPHMARVVPHVPYLRTPTKDSLLWAIDKIMMRRRFTAYDRSITPKFTIVSDMSKSSLSKISNKVGFPLILKPADLGASLLVSICYHEDELKDTLKKTFKRIKGVYKKEGRKMEPRVLVEQFMEGDMYSIDGYVNSRGKSYWCPPCHIKTGKAIGFDDFFGYQQITPTILKPKSIKSLEEVAEKSVKAIGLRSTTVHIEFIRTEDGFKVIEIGPRIGGFRVDMYKLSFGIDHSMNDILIRIPKTPRLTKKKKGYTAALKLFAKKEGTITQLKGIKRIEKLASFHSIHSKAKVGDKARFAKNGGKSIANVIMFNKDRSKLLADIRRLEQLIVIKTK
ncbi:MAG: ATP-grasp domain-containing protein [Candidatus Paceibacterota bacterium]